MKFCQKCGKELLDEAVLCPNCGLVLKEYSEPVPSFAPHSAELAKIFGILSVVVFALLGIPAIILANKSKKETDGVMCRQARIGVICGSIALSCFTLALITFLGGV